MNRDTAFAYFMAHAPETAPQWFRHEPKPELPKEPSKHLTDYTDNADHAMDLQRLCSNWLKDPCWDLIKDVRFVKSSPQEKNLLILFQKTWEDYWNLRIDIKKKQDQNCYFAWRIHYAQEMTKRYLAHNEPDCSHKFITVTADADEGQTFFDPVIAENAEEAEKIISGVRTYADSICDPISMDDVQRWHDIFTRPQESNFWITKENAKQKCDEYGGSWPEDDDEEPKKGTD